MTRAMNTLILTRAHYRRRYGNDAPEQSIPSRFLEEVPSQLIENLGGRTPAWSTPSYSNTYGRRSGHSGEFTDKHYNYEDESQEARGRRISLRVDRKIVRKVKARQRRRSRIPSTILPASSAGNRACSSRPASSHPGMDLPEPKGAAGLKKGQRVRHAKYGEGTVLLREGERRRRQTHRHVQSPRT